MELPVINLMDERVSSLQPSEIPDWHPFVVEGEQYLFVTDASRVYHIGKERSLPIDTAFIRELDLPILNAVKDQPLESHPVTALSLAISQKCNLGCTYCYAEGGSFGGAPKNMPSAVALNSVRRLLAEPRRGGEKVNLAFMGGEPLLNREVLRATTIFASRKAREKGVALGLSVTTNGTLLTEEDARFFEDFGFAVTISLDGIGETHDALRPFKNRRGSFQHIMNRIEPFLNMQKQMQVSARVTVTSSNLDLNSTLNWLLKQGFHSVGFSPLLASASGCNEMNEASLDLMLEQLKKCGESFEKAVLNGRRFGFSNLINAMQEIHQGTHRPYPCGAGAGYFGVSADGDLFACHRFVDDENGLLGDLENGIDEDRQKAWLSNRHVQQQSPCKQCWARYLCGGGCHHEVMARGRFGCKFIRGWLDYCLKCYVRLLNNKPGYFESE